MIYENRFLPRLSSNEKCNISDELSKLAGMEIMNFKSPFLVDENIRKECKNVVIHYLQGSDLFQFLCSAINHEATTLKYRLCPPITTSKLDSDYFLTCLANAGIILDYSYSTLTTSFWIELNSNFHLTLSDMLSIGLCQLIEKKVDLKYNVELRSRKDNIFADVLISSNNRISIINIELAAGLETGVASHISQLEKLKSKIIKAKGRRNDYLSEYILITPAVYKQLPVALQELEGIMTIDNIQEKTQLLEL